MILPQTACTRILILATNPQGWHHLWREQDCHSDNFQCPQPMEHYIRSHNILFPFHPQLWIKANGTVPLHSWFIARLWQYFGTTIAGQSMHASSATAMAEAGAVPELTKGAGWWGSTAFERYIQKNPMVLHALILSQWLHCSYVILKCPTFYLNLI